MPIRDSGGSCSSSSDPFSWVRDQIQSQAICPVFRDQLSHWVADILLRAVGVERHLGAFEGDQQFRFAQLEAGEQFVELGKAGSTREEAVEARLQAGPGAS